MFALKFVPKFLPLVLSGYKTVVLWLMFAVVLYKQPLRLRLWFK